MASTPLDTWKDWLAYHVIEEYASFLPKAFAEERYAFFGKELQGTPQQRPRWQRAVVIVNRLLGDDVGKLYAQRYFPPEAKAQAQAMVANIVAAFRQRIEALSWMDPSTKAEAQAKLNTLYVGVGYTDSWINYSAYEVKADDIFGNIWRGGLFDYHREVARLGAPVDRKEWSMTPQTVNAVNLPLQNALNFPAAILQPPFFDPLAPAAANYGAIGSVIGHEISHTFDTEGSAFDSKGRCATGGRPPISHILKRLPLNWPRSMTPTSPSRTSPSTASRRWPRTSPTLRASPRRMTGTALHSPGRKPLSRMGSRATSSSSSLLARTMRPRRGRLRCASR